MKKIIVSLFTMAALLLPAASQAAEKTGVYVAPKFVLNVQHAKGELSVMGESGSESETEAKAGGAIAVGYDFSHKFNLPIRAELEYGVYGDISKTVTEAYDDLEGSLEVSVGVQTLLANVYWDITTWKNFTPYIGAGLGVAFVDTEGSLGLSYNGESLLSGSRSNTETVFAGQVGFGCSYAFNDYVALDLGYRFLMMGDGEVSADIYGENVKLESQDNYAHQIMLGLRVTF